ncbi:hypothetical protein E2C01_072951 [Portunus trituberculatus]|uniref:Uncharacterized protein n=1 Tax=Portunus trituberculatus TaxID=210409 RepID=A0A5B7ICR4_PORTR|nr:hypothetical protein [Portunus trituberculatus]
MEKEEEVEREEKPTSKLNQARPVVQF